MFLVDTNILLYAAIEEFREHRKARKLVEGWRTSSAPWCSTWPIFYEFLRVGTHPSVFERPMAIAEGLAFLDGILQSPAFSMVAETSRHDEILRELTSDYPDLAGNIIHDFHTVVLMREHGVREIRTADTDFHRFTSLKVVNPLRIN